MRHLTDTHVHYLLLTVIVALLFCIVLLIDEASRGRVTALTVFNSSIAPERS